MDVVYFIQWLDTSKTRIEMIKIGYTNNIDRRFNELQSKYGQELKLLGIMPGNRDTEKKMHKTFNDIHMFKEWFRPEKKLIDFIRNIPSIDTIKFQTCPTCHRTNYIGQTRWQACCLLNFEFGPLL